MAIVERDELIRRISEKVGNDDEALSIIEDLTDTIDSYKVDDGSDWKRKYEENDEAWRNRYKERFLSGEEIKDEQKEDVKDDEESEKLTYNELFEEREG